MKAYIIIKLPEGGYLVRTADMAYSDNFSQMLFATGKIGEALEYIREKMEKAE